MDEMQKRWTGPWLVSIGFEEFVESYMTRYEAVSRDGQCTLIIWGDEDFSVEHEDGDTCLIPRLLTRGEVLALCRLWDIRTNAGIGGDA